MSYNVIQLDNDNQKCWFAGLFVFFVNIYWTQYLVHVWSAMGTRIQTDNTQCSRIVTSVAFKVSYDRPVAFIFNERHWKRKAKSYILNDVSLWQLHAWCTNCQQLYKNSHNISEQKIVFFCSRHVYLSCFCCSTNNDDFKMCFQKVHIEDIQSFDVWNLCHQWQGYFLHIFISVKYMHIKNL